MQTCPSCFGESTALKAVFDEHGEIGTCPTCGDEGVRVLEARELAESFAGIEAYYEPLCGDPYRLANDGICGMGPGSGDDSLVEILREDWEVFSDRITDEQAEEILECLWPDYTGEYMCRPGKRWRDVEDELEEIRKLLLASERSAESSRTAREALTQLLDSWVESLGSTLTRLSWKRAQIQDARDGVFPIERMGAPPDEKASAGRANPKGTAFLYVSSDEATAVAEVRAEPGDWVCVATVEVPARGSWLLDLTRDVRIIDPFAHTDIEAALMVREFLQNFAYELSRPVRKRDADSEYLVTQAICMYFREHGYSGVLFPSSLSSGINAVFFNPKEPTITNPDQRAVWSKSLDVVEALEFDRRRRERRGLPF